MAAALALGLAGCGAAAPHGGTDGAAVATLVAERRPAASALAGLPDGGGADVSALLAGGLTAELAARVALVENRALRVLWADLGVARSEVLQASLLHNPVADAAAAFPAEGGATNLSFGFALDVVDVAYVPLRRRVAAARLEAEKLRVAAEVLDLAWRAETAFWRYQADEESAALRREAADAAVAAAELAERLRRAGNVTELEVATERALAEEARLELRLAEMAARESREHLNEAMGLFGRQTEWRLASSRLPEPPAEPDALERVESRAIERSLDLASAERHLAAGVDNVALDRASGLLPEVIVGARVQRDDGSWQPGPALTLPLPLFDRGQARVARAEADLRRARDGRDVLAVRIRAAARAVRDRVAGHRERARHYRAVLLPLRERVLAETLRHHAAMQLGPADVFEAKRRAVETAIRGVEATHDYWTARSDLALLLAGRLPATEAAPPTPRFEQLPRLPFPTVQ